jgi:hypothetical protein
VYPWGRAETFVSHVAILLQARIEPGEKIMSAIGFNRPGLACEHCGEPFALFPARPDAKKAEELPNPFDATCPFCEAEAAYGPTDFGMLVAEPR